MAPTDAIILDNLIPDTGGVKKREGYSDHATGVGTFVESLMKYSPPSGTEKLFAASVGVIYDVTAAGVASSSVTGLSNGRWQHTMFANSANNFLVACNGADSVRNFDGSSWTTPTITGVSSSTLVNVAVHGGRLWFVEANTLDAWYLPVSSIAGVATKLPLGAFCKKGGSLLAIASWTRDGGSGMDDLFVAVTTKGEAVIYSGIDPSRSATWTKVGTFDIPELVGRRCFVKIGADLGLITSRGVVPLNGILQLSEAGVSKVAATDKISGAFASAYAGSSTFHGWQLIEYPKKGLLFVNVPMVERVTTHQFVMNTATGSWCRFTGMDAGCWELVGGSLYFGGFDGTVRKYGGTFADDGEGVNSVSVSAYSNFGTMNNKLISMVRPMFTGPLGYAPTVGVRSNYDNGDINYVASTSVSLGSAWDEGEWDVAEWAISNVNSARWIPVHAEGVTLSVALATATNEDFQFNTMDIRFTQGGDLE